MSDWLKSTLDATALSVSWETLVVRLVVAMGLGLAITVIFRWSRNPSGQAGTFPATLVLLSILIAMVTQVIGDNVARAFSLVGALSIVRFRTVVRDTKDTAFVIFAVAVGMAVGAGQTVVAIGGIAVVGLAAVLFRDRADFVMPFKREMRLIVRLSWSQALENLIVEAVSKFASEIELQSVETVRQGAAMDLCFSVQMLSTARPTDLVVELNQFEGVHTVELSIQRPDS